MRKFGQQITPYNALPSNFSNELVTGLKNKKYNVNTFLTYTKGHIRDKIGKDYPRRHEYNLLCGALIKEYPVLSDADNPKGFVSE